MEKAKAWLNNQRRNEPIPLSERDESNPITAEEAVRQFKECRADGKQVRSLLHDATSFAYPVTGVKEVVKEMTDIEIAYFTIEEYNCFRVTNTTSAYQFSVIHHLFDTQNQFKAFIIGTIRRADLVKGRAEFALLEYIVSLRSPDREELLAIFIDNAIRQNKWKQIVAIAYDRPTFVLQGLLWQTCARIACTQLQPGEFERFMDAAIPQERTDDAVASIQGLIGLTVGAKNKIIDYLKPK